MTGPGEHEVWFGEAGEGTRARRLGYEIRDALLVVVEGGVRVGWLVRRPLVGTVVENVLVSGMGGLCVDACRVVFAGASDFAETAAKNQHGDFGSGARENRIYGEIRSDRVNYVSSGRWPSNTLLVHGPGCVCEGTKRVRGANPPGEKGGATQYQTTFNVFGTYGAKAPRPQVDSAGMETVASWACGEGCLVPVLDGQSGPVGGAPGPRYTAARDNVAKGREYDRASMGYEDTGGASRFFPQLGSDDVLDWLDALLT